MGHHHQLQMEGGGASPSTADEGGGITINCRWRGVGHHHQLQMKGGGGASPSTADGGGGGGGGITINCRWRGGITINCRSKFLTFTAMHLHTNKQTKQKTNKQKKVEAFYYTMYHMDSGTFQIKLLLLCLLPYQSMAHCTNSAPFPGKGSS